MDEYEILLEAAKRDPEKADFLALRMAYVQSPLFNPYINGVNTPAKVRAAIQQDSVEKIGMGLQQALQDDYLDIEAHAVAFQFYHQNKQTHRAEYHQRFMRGLLDSIITVDGRTPETAFQVISIREEYAVMAVLGLPVHMQRKEHKNGNNFDILSSTHPKTNQPLDLYFNIDLMRTY
ncbi:MAG: DUF4919 domain-containing protein, partial [Anaerolineae bacterium]|nr:DUF4919 domain-containing protein [Anaerolineae bacterium]